MKKYIIGLVAVGMTFLGNAQNDVFEDDTTKIKFKNNTIMIIEQANGNDTVIFSDSCFDSHNDGPYMEPNFEIGMTGYLNPQKGMALPAEQNLMELDYSRSKSVGFNFVLKGADIIEDRLYISPGFGFNWNSYFFKNNVNISTGSDTTNFSLDSIRAFDKYKLRATYFQVPVVIGARFGDPDNMPLGIQLGVIGSYKIDSRVKQKFTQNETSYKEKIKDDYNMSPFKFDLVARVSLGAVGMYGRYSLTSLFEPNKAPELYPFSLGITFGGFLD